MTNERYLKIVTDLTVKLPVTSERKWASFQVTRHTQLVGWVDRRLFHSDSATVSQWQYLLLHVFVVFETIHDIATMKSGLISSVFSLVFGVVYWSRPPRVLRRFTALLYNKPLVKFHRIPVWHVWRRLAKRLPFVGVAIEANESGINSISSSGFG